MKGSISPLEITFQYLLLTAPLSLWESVGTGIFQKWRQFIRLKVQRSYLLLMLRLWLLAIAKEIWLRYLGARAYDNSVYLGACNLIGSNGKAKEFSGGAIVIGPKGDLFNESNVGEEGILAATLSADRINLLRSPDRASMRDTFFLADRRKDLYHELIELDTKY